MLMILISRIHTELLLLAGVLPRRNQWLGREGERNSFYLFYLKILWAES